ncbi:MAG: class I SAM-dependent methyltransferase [Eubacteriaceae bacterium]|jgi:ubiquinone/menaquinone biosynthesis C-methylase UbiE
MSLNSRPLIHEIEQYWTRRAESYSDVIQFEMTHKNEAAWMDVIVHELPRSRYPKILDIGTGPGFFAIGLAKRGYQVTAVDYTQAMLEEAMQNSGDYRNCIRFRRMDAHHLDFPDESFDAIVTRNLTWNLEQPQKAYADWSRVLRPGGRLLNFDAGWYSYLFDDEKACAFERDRSNVVEQGVFDYNGYSESAVMENISKNLILSRCKRPESDVRMLENAGFQSIAVDRHIGESVWDEVEKINYESTPMFMICAEK